MKYIYESDFEENIIDMIKNLGFEYYSGSEIREQFQSMNSNRNVVITELGLNIIQAVRYGNNSNL